jgi:signal peptidase I
MDSTKLALGLRWTVLGLLATGLLLLSLPRAAGWQYLTILSGSMAPAIETGALVVARPVPPGAASVGDVITFRDPLDPARLITHRILDVEHTRGVVAFETRGDANPASERWTVATTGTVGLTVLIVPAAGRWLASLTSPVGRVLLVGLPALGLGISLLCSLWAPVVRRGSGWSLSLAELGPEERP